MLTSDQRFELNALEVAAKVIDNEAIIMNLATGMYYSMDGTGAVIWDWLERGLSVGQVVEALADRYDVPPAHASADVEELIRRLLEEGLVRAAANQELKDEGVPSHQGPKLGYSSPELNRYGDMADLLALDPPMPKLASTPWTAPKEER